MGIVRRTSSPHHGYALPLDANLYPIESEYINSFKPYIIKCPNLECQKASLYMEFFIKEEQCPKLKLVYPANSHIPHKPEGVPEYIYNLYKEAFSIHKLSSNAAGALARKCLEEILTDFHKLPKGNLHSMIEKLRKDKPEYYDDVLHDIRAMGNIGTHLKKRK